MNEHRIRRTESTGQRIEVRHKYNVEIPKPKPGEHLWVAMVIFRLSDPGAERFHLDHENLVTVEGPGCYICEQTWSMVKGRPCPGDPTGRTRL